uniref:Uncharacterized protein n=1 Tax=Rhizophora mucronata TaxID=61149 RepID=A0A2P2JE93_RHIMU
MITYIHKESLPMSIVLVVSVASMHCIFHELLILGLTRSQIYLACSREQW